VKSEKILTTEPMPDAGGMDYGMWLQLVGRDPVTGWRWAKAGVVQTENVFGRPFITSDEIKRFWARVKLGEFAREAKVPRKTAKTAN
jgi:hypothetical protein